MSYEGHYDSGIFFSYLRANQTEKFHCLQSILRSKCLGRYMADMLPCLKLSVYYRKKHLNKHKFGSAKYYLHMDNFSFFIMKCLTMRKKCKMLAQQISYTNYIHGQLKCQQIISRLIVPFTRDGSIPFNDAKFLLIKSLMSIGHEAQICTRYNHQQTFSLIFSASNEESWAQVNLSSCLHLFMFLQGNRRGIQKQVRIQFYVQYILQELQLVLVSIVLVKT